MKKYKIAALSFIFLILTLLPFPAQAEDMMDNLLPSETDKKQEGSVKLEYNEYDLFQYGMDTKLEESEFSDLMPWGWDDGVGKQINQGMATINSTLWSVNKIIYYVVGTLVSESFEFDYIGSFATQISQAVSAIAGFGPGGYAANGLWPYLIMIILCFVGAWAAYVGVVKRATSHALSGIITSVVIMTIALGFFSNTEKILNGVNGVASTIQNDMLTISISATTPGKLNEDEGMASMRNQIFNLMVKYPWLLLEFGTSDVEKVESEWKKSGSRVDAILSTDFYSQERKDAIKYETDEMKNNNMGTEALTDRFVILLLTLLVNIIMGGVLLLLSGSLVLYQILALVFTVFTPVALLIGLIPSFSNTAKN
ncbi:MAG: CD3337/EF1877 family mobilome membrane protein, partial [Bacillus sp. (in: firmicutes)]